MFHTLESLQWVGDTRSLRIRRFTSCIIKVGGVCATLPGHPDTTGVEKWFFEVESDPDDRGEGCL